MPAYLIVTREEPVADADSFAEYRRRTREIGGEIALVPRVVYGATEALEGDAPDGVVVLEFENMDEARAWYNSPGYQDALPFRLKSAKHRAFIVEGL